MGAPENAVLFFKKITRPLAKFAQGVSEFIYDSEAHFVSEVSPDGEVLANLTSLVRSTDFTAKQLHFRVSENFT
ncbi:MAG: hypothetical protein J6D20_06825 [Clostridia bacterium]|nr:hypothetical protein [Clostridia bacterium]